MASLTGLEPAFNGLEIRSIIRSGTAIFRNGRQGRTRTYVVSNVRDLQSRAFATQLHLTLKTLDPFFYRFAVSCPKDGIAVWVYEIKEQDSFPLAWYVYKTYA